MKLSILLLMLLPLFQTANAQEPVLAPNAPKDQPGQQTSMEKFERDIAPYVAQAKAFYPAAKSRFLKGLPKGESFFITTRLTDRKGRVEQVFVAVQDIADGKVSGRVWSTVMHVEGYRYGDRIVFPEERMLDWLITKPDGTEEGNFVGKFLDSYER